MLNQNDYDFLYDIMSKCHERETTFVYWYKSGEQVKNFNEVDNITLTCPSSDFYVDVYKHELKILNWKNDIQLIFSTEDFIENNDEEFFQQSTVQDFSNFEEKFIKELIRITMMLRDGKNI